MERMPNNLLIYMHKVAMVQVHSQLTQVLAQSLAIYVFCYVHVHTILQVMLKLCKVGEKIKWTFIKLLMKRVRCIYIYS